MAELKISDYIDVDSIDGTELILVSKDGSYRKTTIEEIRNLASDIANTELAELLNKAASAQDVKNILNTINTNLKNHSDSITSINAQLSEIPNQTYVTEKAKTVDVNNALALKANIADLNTQKTRIDNLVQTASTSYYEKCISTDTGALLIVSSGATTSQINLPSVTPVATGYTPIVGDYVRLVYGVSSGSSELVDARVGADGNIYNNTGDAIRNQTNFASTIKQLLDSSKCEVGWYYNGSAINAKTANSSYMTIAMQLKAGTYCGGVDYNFSFVLINGTLTALKNISGTNRYLNTASGLSYDYFVQFIVPSDATYYLTFRTSLDVALPAMLFKTDEQLFLTKSYSFGDIYKTYINTLSINDDINILKDEINKLTTRVINVDKTGNGDYTSLTAAVNSVDTGQKATIYIQPNNYDLLAELGGDTFLATIDGTDNRKGISFKNKDIALIGIGNVNLSLEIPDAKLNVNIATCISAFEVYGNFSMENITLKVKNTRYAIHDESGNSWAYRYSNHKFKKCHFIHEGNIMWGNPTPYGCGTGTGASYEFDDCIFESDGSHYAWTMHNNANQYSIKVSFNGCYFNGLYNGKNIRFGYYGANTARNDIFVKNCILTNGIDVLLENSSVSSNNVWDIYNFDEKTVTIGA